MHLNQYFQSVAQYNIMGNRIMYYNANEWTLCVMLIVPTVQIHPKVTLNTKFKMVTYITK